MLIEFPVHTPSEKPSSPEHNAASYGGHSNSSGQTIVRNVFASYCFTFIGMLTGLLGTPFLVRHLGKEAYGTWILLVGTAGYLRLIEFGLGTATAKRIAECRATGDMRRLDEVLGTAFTLFLLLTILSVCGGLAILAFVLPHLNIPAPLYRASQICFMMLVANQALLFYREPFSVASIGVGRIGLALVPGIFIAVISLLLQILATYMGMGIIPLGIISILNSLASGIALSRAVAKYFPEIEFRLQSANYRTMKELVRFSVRNGIVVIAKEISYSSDSIIIGAMLSVANVTNYAVASKLAGLMRILSLKPIDMLLPAYAHANALHDRARQFQLYVEGFTLSLSLAFPALIALCIHGDQLIRLWVGGGHQESYPILAVLVVMVALQISGHAGMTIMTATERNEILAQLTICSALVNLALSILFTHLFGAIGPALGSLVTVGVVDLTILPLLVCRTFDFNYRLYLTQSWGTLILAILSTSLVAIAWRHLLGTGTIATLGGIVIEAVTFWIVWLFIGTPLERRHSYLNRLNRIIKPLKVSLRSTAKNSI